MSDTLLLNANYLPLGVISWKKAFTHLSKDKVQVVEEYEDWLVREDTRVPAIVRLTDLVSFSAKIKFSRDNVYIRDKYTCQYCGISTPRKSDLTFDHVVPKSRGGKTNFLNIVTACVPCNTRKADKTPEEAGMILKRAPDRPSHIYYAMYKVAMTMSHPSWEDYAGIYSGFVK